MVFKATRLLLVQGARFILYRGLLALDLGPSIPRGPMVSKGAPSVLIYGSPLLVDAPLTLDLGSVPPKGLVMVLDLGP